MADRHQIPFMRRANFATDLNAHLGSAFSLEPILTHSAWFRVTIARPDFRTCNFVGAVTHPGAGFQARRERQATAALIAGGATVKRLAVYCGSASPADPVLSKPARSVGRHWPDADRRGLWRRPWG